MQKLCTDNFLQYKNHILIAQQFYIMWKLCVSKFKKILRDFRYSVTIFYNIIVVQWLHNNFIQNESPTHLNLYKRVLRGFRHLITIFYNVKVIHIYINLGKF